MAHFQLVATHTRSAVGPRGRKTQRCSLRNSFDKPVPLKDVKVCGLKNFLGVSGRPWTIIQVVLPLGGRCCRTKMCIVSIDRYSTVRDYNNLSNFGAKIVPNLDRVSTALKLSECLIYKMFAPIDTRVYRV